MTLLEESVRAGSGGLDDKDETNDSRVKQEKTAVLLEMQCNNINYQFDIDRFGFTPPGTCHPALYDLLMSTDT